MIELASLASVTITSFLVIVLARAVWHKAEGFLETVGFAQGYGLVPDALAAPIVRALMLAEAAAILALMVPAWRAAGGVLAAGLFVGYGAIMTAALDRDADLAADILARHYSKTLDGLKERLETERPSVGRAG